MTVGETESVEGIRLGTTSPPNGSRVKRMLFRRARSETTDEERTRQFRFNKTEGSSATTGVTSAISPRLGSSHNQQNPFSVEAAPVHRFLNPQSPPPPYDTPTEVMMHPLTSTTRYPNIICFLGKRRILFDRSAPVRLRMKKPWRKTDPTTQESHTAPADGPDATL